MVKPNKTTGSAENQRTTAENIGLDPQFGEPFGLGWPYSKELLYAVPSPIMSFPICYCSMVKTMVRLRPSNRV